MLSSCPTRVHTATIRLYSPRDAVVAKPVQHLGGNTSYIARVIYHSASLPAVRTTLPNRAEGRRLDGRVGWRFGGGTTSENAGQHKSWPSRLSPINISCVWFRMGAAITWIGRTMGALWVGMWVIYPSDTLPSQPATLPWIIPKRLPSRIMPCLRERALRLVSIDGQVADVLLTGSLVARLKPRPSRTQGVA